MVRRLAFLRSILIFKKIDIYKCPKKEKPKNSLKNEYILGFTLFIVNLFYYFLKMQTFTKLIRCN